jgi:flagella basal body P-ring formation protein FlgA
VGEVFITAHGEVLADAMVGEEVAVLNRATRSVQRGVYEGDLIVVLEQ